LSLPKEKMADATVLGMGGRGISVSTDPLFMINVAFSVASGLHTFVEFGERHFC
jgi:hypothetical protein